MKKAPRVGRCGVRGLSVPLCGHCGRYDVRYGVVEVCCELSHAAGGCCLARDAGGRGLQVEGCRDYLDALVVWGDACDEVGVVADDYGLAIVSAISLTLMLISILSSISWFG